MRSPSTEPDETIEATGLRCGDVQAVDGGLQLSVPGRRRPTGVPAARGRHCPLTYWTTGRRASPIRPAQRPACPRFPAIAGRVVTGDVGLNALTLIRIVDDAAKGARLAEDYTWTSLRIGFVRTAVRGKPPEPLIIERAGLHTLKGLTLAHRTRARHQPFRRRSGRPLSPHVTTR